MGGRDFACLPQGQRCVSDPLLLLATARFPVRLRGHEEAGEGRCCCKRDTRGRVAEGTGFDPIPHTGGARNSHLQHDSRLQLMLRRL